MSWVQVNSHVHGPGGGQPPQHPVATTSQPNPPNFVQVSETCPRCRIISCPGNPSNRSICKNTCTECRRKKCIGILPNEPCPGAVERRKQSYTCPKCRSSSCPGTRLTRHKCQNSCFGCRQKDCLGGTTSKPCKKGSSSSTGVATGH
jgi:hypothetical protein